MAIIGHLRDREWFGCPYYLDCMYLTVAHSNEVYCHFHFCIRSEKLGCRSGKLEQWQCFILTLHRCKWNKDKRKKDSREQDLYCSGLRFQSLLLGYKAHFLWHLCKCRIPLRISSLLLWIGLNTKSKPGNGRQTPWLTTPTPKSLKSSGYLV